MAEENQAPAAEQQEGRVSCPECGKSFAGEQGMKIHRGLAHREAMRPPRESQKRKVRKAAPIAAKAATGSPFECMIAVVREARETVDVVREGVDGLLVEAKSLRLAFFKLRERVSRIEQVETAVRAAKRAAPEAAP